MTLSKLFVAAVMLFSALAQADIVRPDNRRDGGGHYGPIRPGPGRGDDYGPIRPGPGRGDDRGPIRPPDRNRRVSEEVYVGRYVRDESIDLMRAVRHLHGYRVESIRVHIDTSNDRNSSVDLLVNRRPEDSARTDMSRMVDLQPRSFLEVGRNLSNLDVYFRGKLQVDRIVIILTSENDHRPPPPYDDGREISVTLNLPAYFPPHPRLELTQYVDTYRYRGYTIRGVELTAVARYNTASLDVEINGFREGTVRVTTRQSTQTVRSRQNFVIGSSFGSLVLVPRGDSNIVQVRLILSRY